MSEKSTSKPEIPAMSRNIYHDRRSYGNSDEEENDVLDGNGDNEMPVQQRRSMVSLFLKFTDNQCMWG